MLGNMTPTPPSARERILRTAHDLFYQNGVRATGVDRIIAESGVAKLTFYRHFPSKNDLIRSYLEDRHTRWMNWFVSAIALHGGGPDAIVPLMAEWLEDPTFRGCAFLNSVSELADSLPEVLEMTQRHKNALIDTIASLLPETPQRKALAQAMALAIDGAIVRTQFDGTPEIALEGLQLIMQALKKGNGGNTDVDYQR